MYQKATLHNGLRVITVPMPHTLSVSICIFVGIGSRYEAQTEAGISHFIEHLLFKGTLKRETARVISEAIEGMGGILNGGTNKELTTYWCKVARPHFNLALDVLVDMLLNAKFDSQDIEKERQIIIEEINMGKDSPAQRVDMLIDELLWPGHPLGRDIAGSKESVSAITRDTILDYWGGQYLPSSTVIVVAGNVEHHQVVTAVNRLLGGWANRRERPGYTEYKEQPNKCLLIEVKDTEQVNLCLALPGLSLFHPQRFALDMLNIVLGGGMGSRLFSEIRDELGLAYSIHSYAEHFLDSGSFVISAGVEPKNLLAVIEAILKQLSLIKETIPAPELSKAKELWKGRILLRMEDSRNIAGWVGGQEILTERILSVEQMISIIDAITADELKQIAQELLVDSQLRLAVVGRVSEYELSEKLLKM